MQNNSFKFVFWGTSEFSVIFLEELKGLGLIPDLIVTVENKPKGRNLLLSPPPAKIWAEKSGIPFLQPKKHDSELVMKLEEINPDFFLVASYGKIIPQNILGIPKLGTLNIHPSLLPKLRGPSPIQTAILSENETGVSIIKLDAEMDHGPIIAQKKVEIEWPPYAKDLENILAKEGAILFAQVLPDWMAGKVRGLDQNHSLATFTKKFGKTDAEIALDSSPEHNLRKIRAFSDAPRAYFFAKGKRIIVKKALLQGGKLVLERVVPEGKKEMNYSDFLKGNKV